MAVNLYFANTNREPFRQVLMLIKVTLYTVYACEYVFVVIMFIIHSHMQIMIDSFCGMFFI